MPEDFETLLSILKSTVDLHQKVDELIEQRAIRATPTSIQTKNTEENISSMKAKIWKRVEAYAFELPTTNLYVDSEILDARMLQAKLFHIGNSHATNSLTYKLLACVDSRFWTELVAATPLAASAEAIIVQTDSWAFYKFQVKSTVDDTPAKVKAFMAGASL